MTLLLLVLAMAQGGDWVAFPARPTVGDTVWLVRAVSAPAGWRLRAGKLEPGATFEGLGDGAVLRTRDGWVVRYPVAFWSPGNQVVALPPIWRLGPRGQTDSLPGGSATVVVRSVIPDSVRQPEPRGSMALVRREQRNPVPFLLAIVLSTGLLAGGLAWRRRPSRPAGSSPHVPLEPEVADERWLAAGEPKAVAARAAGRLRAALAGVHPGASVALSTTECLAALQPHVPDIQYRQLSDVLVQLDRVAFASAHGADVAAVARRARALAEALER